MVSRSLHWQHLELRNIWKPAILLSQQTCLAQHSAQAPSTPTYSTPVASPSSSSPDTPTQGTEGCATSATAMHHPMPLLWRHIIIHN